ncbi:MAG: hypothetical protein R2939_06320 [Kofleriaceae bacterium]
MTAGASVLATALLAPADAHADLELKWASAGYMRTRTVLLTNLAPQDRVVGIYQPAPDADDDIVIPDIRNTSYIMSRARLLPKLTYGNVASVNLQIDAMDDVLWGDNTGVSTAPLFATDGSYENYLGGPPSPTVNVKRAWLEFQVPVGLMRVGRMPSHWGMGLLANGGGTADLDPTSPIGEPPRKALDNFMAEDFGDKHFGSTADRILFITKPLSIYRTVKKQGKTDSNLIVGYAFGKISEAPLLTFEPFERRFRPFGQQGFISRGKNDDINEHVFIAVYNNADWDKKKFTDELRIGAYGVIRDAAEGTTNPSAIDPSQTCGTFDGTPTPCVDTGSKVFIADLWWRIRIGNLFTEGEGCRIFGDTFGGVPFPSRNTKKDADITGGVARVGYVTDRWDALLEVGHASGDDDLGDEHFTQRPMHPDFNVGLILFEETLRELSARVYGVPFFSDQNPNGATGFFSNGGVINANYVNPKGRYRVPKFGLEVYGGLLMAWVDTLAENGAAMFYADDTDGSSYLGTEVDLGLRTSFNKHMRFALETGYLRFGKALKSQLTNADGSFTLQSSIAFVW